MTVFNTDPTRTTSVDAVLTVNSIPNEDNSTENADEIASLFTSKQVVLTYPNKLREYRDYLDQAPLSGIDTSDIANMFNDLSGKTHAELLEIVGPAFAPLYFDQQTIDNFQP